MLESGSTAEEPARYKSIGRKCLDVRIVAWLRPLVNSTVGEDVHDVGPTILLLCRNRALVEG
jgi:hypothetical protein